MSKCAIAQLLLEVLHTKYARISLFFLRSLVWSFAVAWDIFGWMRGPEYVANVLIEMFANIVLYSGVQWYAQPG